MLSDHESVSNLRRRASAVIIRDNTVLLIRRQKPGEVYYVFPGGGVEDGEMAYDAIIRELAEEAGVQGTIERPLAVLAEGYDINAFYLCSIPQDAKPIWQEQEKQTPDNAYAFEWVLFEGLADIDLRPASANERIVMSLNENYPLDMIKMAHKHSSNHREEIEKSTLCGCFYCMRMYSPSEIEDWIGDEGVAPDGHCPICPYCGIDSVIGNASPYPVKASFLRAMSDHWF